MYKIKCYNEEKDFEIMKKILLFVLLLLPLCVIAEENYVVAGVEEPQWKDFVPPAFVDVKAPKGIGKLNDTAVYWYKRRMEFESGIEKCREVENTEEKIACYQKLKTKQYSKNSDYNARLEAIENERKLPMEMQNPTANMLPLNNALNSFMHYQPNEFR